MQAGIIEEFSGQSKFDTRILHAIDQCSVDNDLSLRGIDLSTTWSEKDAICVLKYFENRCYISLCEEQTKFYKITCKHLVDISNLDLSYTNLCNTSRYSSENLFGCLFKFPYFHSLNLSNNNLGDARDYTIRCLGNFVIQFSKRCKTINLSCNQFYKVFYKYDEPHWLRSFVGDITSGKEAIILCNNGLDKLQGQAWDNFIEFINRKKLHHIDLRGNNFKQWQVEHLVQKIGRNYLRFDDEVLKLAANYRIGFYHLKTPLLINKEDIPYYETFDRRSLASA